MGEERNPNRRKIRQIRGLNGRQKMTKKLKVNAIRPARRHGLRLHKLNPTPYRLFALGMAAFVFTFLASSIFNAPGTSTAQDFTVTNSAIAYALDVTSAHSATNPVEMEITPNATALATSSDVVTTKTNAPGGYQLYFSMNTDDENGNRLYLGGDSSKAYLSPAAGTFDDPAALSGSAWGYTTEEDNVEAKLYSAPPLKSSAQVISESSDPTSSSGDQKTVYFAATASGTQLAGDYKNTILYTAVAESPDLVSVSPSKLPLRGGSIVIATSLSTSEEELGDATVSLWKNGEEKAACENVTLETVNDFVSATCDAPRLISGTYTVKLTLEKFSRTFTATDALTYEKQAGESDTFQEFTLDMCAALETNEALTLVDTRDEKEYGVVKAADGNCWMTDNLKYDIAESTTWNTNDYSKNLLHIATNEGYAGEYYYNWPAALESCPNGWSLPVNGDEKTNRSFAKLLNSYSITTGAGLVANEHLGFDFYGIWDWSHNSEYSQGTYGYFWSSTPINDASAYSLVYNNTAVTLQSSHTKGNGFSVRCVFGGSSDELMQNFTLKECAALETDEKKYLYDSRNNARYGVVKAADGNCWMTDNLKIYDATISSADSNFAQGTFTLPASSTWNTNVTSEAKIHVAENSGYEGEVYYDWYAATAGSTVSSGNAGSSICPKGWTLPVNGDATTNLSFAKLLDAYDIDTGAKLIANKKLGFSKYYGHWNYNYSSEKNQGSNGYFWSSTAQSEAYAYRLAYESTGITSQDDNTRGHGLSIRCVLDSRTLEDLTYMQEMTPAICANTTESTKKTLLDRRGNYSAGSSSGGYGVVKAKDGNCWMTANFNLYNVTVSAELSDFTSGTYAIPNTSNWSSNIYNSPRAHRGTNSGYTDQVYYNWTAAVALSDGSTTAQQDTSICPKGWTLPVSGDESTDKSYAKLLDAYDTTTDLGFTSYYGAWLYDRNSEYDQGSYGYFWSSTPYSGANAYDLSYRSGGAWPQNSNPKGHGFSIRCVSRS